MQKNDIENIKNSGKKAELLAKKYLKRQCYHIVAQNYHSRMGEIDIIASNEEHVLFVEVRYRGLSQYSSASQSICSKKQKRIILCAMQYLQQHPQYANKTCRFDVITFDQHINMSQLKWIKAAFLMD